MNSVEGLLEMAQQLIMSAQSANGGWNEAADNWKLHYQVYLKSEVDKKKAE
jgi:hypothetical protein